jgi:uncharacterized coiled-coil protein SlyX
MEEMNQKNPAPSAMPKFLAIGAFAVLAIVNGVLFQRVNSLESTVAKQQTAFQTQVAEVRQLSNDSLHNTVAELTSQLELGTKAASAEGQKAALAAQRKAEKLVGELAAQQKTAAEELNKQLGEVRTAADESTAKVTGMVSGLETSVGSVKDEVAQTKTTLDQTISDLKSVRGDLGVQSGLIATNAQELAALREVGDRTYYEFTIRKGAGPAKVGNMTVELKKSDVKRNKYNVAIVADDKMVEKKDRTINEPVQMYVSGARQPYEMVVNQVQKNAIVGYVAVPKVMQSRR